MTNSSSDSDYFESADEGFDVESTDKNDNISTKFVKKEFVQCETSSSISVDVSSTIEKRESPGDGAISTSVQYRKRPERQKTASNPVQPIMANCRTSLDEQTFKTDIIKPDVLIQDITNNISKNFNKGFSTLQQTSSSIKDLVISSFHVSNVRESSNKFSYDDDDDDDDDNVDDSDKRDEHEVEEDNHRWKTNPQVLDCEDDGTKLVKEAEQDKNNSVNDIKSANLVVAEQAFNPNLCTEINAIEISDSPNSCMEEKMDNNISVDPIKDLDDGTHEKLQNLLHLRLHSEISKETKNITENLMKDIWNESEGEQIIDGSTKRELEKEKIGVKEFKVVPKNQESTLIADFSEKDGWDLSELDIKELEIEENCSVVKESGVKKELEKVQESEIPKDNEGWDDFDIDDEELEVVKKCNESIPPGKSSQFIKQDINHMLAHQGSEISIMDENKNFGYERNWSGWDNFGEKQYAKQKSSWNLGGWGVSTLLNTASSVTQGLTNVIEAGLGAPDPMSLAQMLQEFSDDNEKLKLEKVQKESSLKTPDDDNSNSGLNLFPSFGITRLVAGVTKNIVENTKVHGIGTKVITGGLDTLESFGKKTMEVLQEGDPGLKKSRAILLGQSKPVLSQILREAKSKAEMEDKRMEERQLAKMWHFETLFDDYEGLIHLEALEMLSTQCELKLEQMKVMLPTNEVEDLIGILDEVKELCVIDEDEFKANYSRVVDFKISLIKATESLKNEISIHKIIQVYEELDAWLKNEENTKKSAQIHFQKALSTMAKLTAATVAQFHKGGELLSIKQHRKTVEEADALLQMTGFLCCEISNISQKFLKLQTSQLTEKDKLIIIKITEEANNATSYIKDAFNLLIPVLQLGAAT